MKDLNKYIDSGVIENYCLGIASPEEAEELFKLAAQFPKVREHLTKVQDSLELYLRSFEVVMPPKDKERVKNNILDVITLDRVTLSHEGMLSEFINISNPSSFIKLEALIKDLHPPTDYDNVYAKTLFSDGAKELNLVWVKEIVPMEEHHHLDESFLVFEGTADCNIDGVITKMSRGDFMRITPESHHEVVITSSFPAKAIQCRIAI